MKENDPSAGKTDPKTHTSPPPAPEKAASPQDGTATSGGRADGALEEIARLESELAAAKKDATEHYDRYLRSVADLENVRKRAVREKDELRQFATSRVLEDLIPVLDSLSLGLAAAKAPKADIQGVVGGVEMVLNQARAALAQHGLKDINPVGQPFDPNLHESIAAQPSKDVPEGSVVSVVRIGYSLNGRVLRPASVVVSSGAPAKTAEASR